VESAVAAAKDSSLPDLVVAAKLITQSEPRCAPIGVALMKLAEEPSLLDDLPSFVHESLCSWKQSAPVQPCPEAVLPGLLMKNDEFDGIHILGERVHPMVWNFRQASGGLPVFGVGQCHLDGLVFLAQHLKAAGFPRVRWFNMREEPLVFLNGTACAPRVEGKLNENVDYLLSIEGHELDAMEARLRDDCLEASQASADGLLLWKEIKGENSNDAVKVQPEKSFSVRSAYGFVNEQEGAARITYTRVPIADETAPEEQDFDQLVRELRGVVAPADLKEIEECSKSIQDELKRCALVFNCHMGRGRTTTGMVCASIMVRAAGEWTAPSSATLPKPEAAGRDLSRGEFGKILELLWQLESLGSADAGATEGTAGLGLRSKLMVDQCADECGEVTNLVGASAKCIEKAAKAELREQQQREHKAGADEETAPGVAQLAEEKEGSAFWKHRGVKYLERYAYLLLFAGYVQLAKSDGFRTSFSAWMRRHWAFKRTIKELALS